MNYGEHIKTWYAMTEDEARDYINNVPTEFLDIIRRYDDSKLSNNVRLAQFIQDIAQLFASDNDLFEYLAAFLPHEEAA